MSDFKVGDAVEVYVTDDGGMPTWVPAIVDELRENTTLVKRRGNHMERLGAILCGFKGDRFAALPQQIRHAEVEFTGDRADVQPFDAQSSRESRAMKSAMAWYTEFMHFERRIEETKLRKIEKFIARAEKGTSCEWVVGQIRATLNDS